MPNSTDCPLRYYHNDWDLNSSAVATILRVLTLLKPFGTHTYHGYIGSKLIDLIISCE